MTRFLPRAIAFALLALIAWALLSMIASAVVVGLPVRGEELSAYQARLAGHAATIDLIVGVLVMLLFGWLTARPFSGRDSLAAASLFAITYIALEFGFAYLFSGGNGLDVQASLRTYAFKIVAALIGGWLAGRVRLDAEEPVSPDQG
jgi:hypothetical protein